MTLRAEQQRATLRTLAGPLVDEVLRLRSNEVDAVSLMSEDEHMDYRFSGNSIEDLVREVAREILAAAEANGYGGCRLCRS